MTPRRPAWHGSSHGIWQDDTPLRAAAAPEGDSICANHRRYVAMDARLQRTPLAIRTHFFAAAACVTHPLGGLGVLDGRLAGLVFDPPARAFLRFIHARLAVVNQDWFERLQQGMDVPGCEGKRGTALDHALVDREQAHFTRSMVEFFGSDTQRQARLLAAVNATLHRHPLLRRPLLEERLGAALATVRARRRIDLGDETHRCSVGHALVDLIRAAREPRSGDTGTHH